METLLQAEVITREAFDPFGQVIMAEGADHFTINEGTTERYHDLAGVDVMADGGRPLLNIFRAQPRSLPMRLSVMERHPLGSHAFVPLSRNPYLVVVAPPGNAPSAAELRAFAVTAGVGVNYDRGVWHHPLIALDETSDFLVIDRGGPQENCEEVALDDATLLDWVRSNSNG